MKAKEKSKTLIKKKQAVCQRQSLSLLKKKLKPWESGVGKNRVVTTINPDALINETVIDRVKYQMVLLGNGDAQPKTTEVVKKTPVGINETNKVINEMLTVPAVPKKKMQWQIYIQKFLACTPQQDQIISFLHMFLPKSAHVGGWHPLQ